MDFVEHQAAYDGRVHRVISVLCSSLAACSFSTGLQEMAKDGAPNDDVPRATDAAIDAAGSAPCGTSTPRILEAFDAAPAGPLGVSGGSATLVLAQATLQISTTTNGQNAYCNEQDLASWSGNGATIEIPAVMTGNNAWTSFQVLGPNMAITEKNNVLVFSDNTGATPYAMVAYNATTMRWWRLRPDAGNTNVIAEYSPDRLTWTMLGSRAGGGTIRVQMIAGTDGTASPAGASRYDNLVVCP